MDQRELMQEEEIYLFDILEKLRNGWRTLLGTVVLALLIAAGAIFLIKPQYEAVAIVQVGQVAGAAVESVQQTAERLKAPMFQLRVAKAIGDDDWTERLQNRAAGTAKDVSVQVLKSANLLIELKTLAPSRVEAIRKAEAMILQLAMVQEELAKPTMQKLQNDLVIDREKLALAEKDLQGLGKLVTSASIRDERFAQLSLMTTLRLQKESELFGLRQSVLALETSLLPPATQPAKAMEHAFSSSSPVSPKKGLLMTFAGVGGLFLGILVIFLRDAWQARRQPEFDR